VWGKNLPPHLYNKTAVQIITQIYGLDHHFYFGSSAFFNSLSSPSWIVLVSISITTIIDGNYLFIKVTSQSNKTAHWFSVEHDMPAGGEVMEFVY